MADTKVSALPAVVTPAGTDEFPVNQAATSKKATLTQIADFVIASDSEIAAIAGLTSAADRLAYFTGSGTAALATFTAAGRNLVDDADAAAQRATLGLGGLAWSTVAGTSFPGSPTTNDRFYRTDLGIEYLYDGTRWLSTQVFYAVSSKAGGQSSSGADYASVVFPEVGDKHIENFSMGFIVDSGGTALSASHKWEVQPRKSGTGSTASNIGSLITIDSGSSGVWRVSTPQTINALMGSTYGVLGIGITKTGTPGNLRPMYTFTYRLVGA